MRSLQHNFRNLVLISVICFKRTLEMVQKYILMQMMDSQKACSSYKIVFFHVTAFSSLVEMEGRCIPCNCNFFVPYYSNNTTYIQGLYLRTLNTLFETVKCHFFLIVQFKIQIFCMGKQERLTTLSVTWFLPGIFCCSCCSVCRFLLVFLSVRP